jgi:hypothetical protein
VARKITSTLLVWIAFASAVFGQGGSSPAPRFAPLLPSAPATASPSVYTETTQPIEPAKTAQPSPRRRTTVDERAASTARTELPGPNRLFQRESEEEFFERIAQEMKAQSGSVRAIFPESSVVTKASYQPRAFPEMVELVEPAYVCHRRLYFEQPNFERTGYNFGILQPAVNLGTFYYDVAMLPYHFWTDLRDRSECNVGKCLPGDPAPFLIPRERLSVTGAVGQAGTIFGLLYLFPR